MTKTEVNPDGIALSPEELEWSVAAAVARALLETDDRNMEAVFADELQSLLRTHSSSATQVKVWILTQETDLSAISGVPQLEPLHHFTLSMATDVPTTSVRLCLDGDENPIMHTIFSHSLDGLKSHLSQFNRIDAQGISQEVERSPLCGCCC